MIEFRDLDYAFDVFSGAISLKEALAARLFATHGANSKGVAYHLPVRYRAAHLLLLAKRVPQITPQLQPPNAALRLAHLRSTRPPIPSELLRSIRTDIKENLHERF